MAVFIDAAGCEARRFAKQESMFPNMEELP
jgi:hypothetical protein